MLRVTLSRSKRATFSNALPGSRSENFFPNSDARLWCSDITPIAQGHADDTKPKDDVEMAFS
jgi:hypothetical protein